MLLNLKKNVIAVFPLAIILPLLFLGAEFVAVFGLAVFFYLCLALFYRQNDFLFFFLIAIAFVLRILLVLLNEKIAVLPFQPDSFYYSSQALKILDNVSRNLPVYYDMPVSNSVKSYSLFLAQIYALLGERLLVAAVINVIFGVLAAIFVFKITWEIFENKRAAYFALIMSLFFPTIIAFTSYVLRDSIVFFLTMVMLYHFIMAGKSEKRLGHIIIAILTFVLVGTIRIQNLYLYTMFFLLFYTFKFLKSNSRLVYKIGLLASLVVVSFFFILSYQELFLNIATYPLRAQPLRAVGGSAYLLGMQYNSLFDVLKYLPIRFIYFTFGPFLWQANSAFLLLAALEGLIILALFYFVIQYFRTNRIDKNFDEQILLLLFCLVGLLANSMVDSNFGTSVRHRMIYIVFFFMFAGAYLRNVKLKFF